MPPILPSIIGSPRGGRVQAQSIRNDQSGLGAISQGINMLSIEGAASLTAKYLNRQNDLAQKEQQVLATQAHNSISAELNLFSNEFAQSDNPDWTSFDKKFETKSSELYSKAAEKLSPFAQKKLKDSMIINEQGYKNNVQGYREKQLARNRELSSAGTYKQSEQNASTIPPSPGKPDLFFDQFVVESGKRADQVGLQDTPASINRYMQSSGQSIENFNSQSLSDSKKVVEKQLKGLKVGTNEYTEKKVLLDSIDSAIARKNFIQNGVDRVQTARFNGYIKEGTPEGFFSANNLIQNSSPEGGGYQVSEAVLGSMKKTLKGRVDIEVASNNSNLAIANVRAENPNANLIGASELNLKISTNGNNLLKSMNNLDPKIQKMAMDNYSKQSIALKQNNADQRVDFRTKVRTLWDEQKLKPVQISQEIDKLFKDGVIDNEQRLALINQNHTSDTVEATDPGVKIGRAHV